MNWKLTNKISLLYPRWFSLCLALKSHSIKVDDSLICISNFRGGSSSSYCRAFSTGREVQCVRSCNLYQGKDFLSHLFFFILIFTIISILIHSLTLSSRQHIWMSVMIQSMLGEQNLFTRRQFLLVFQQ